MQQDAKEKEDMIPLLEACSILGIKHGSLREAVYRNRIKSKKVNRNVLVSLNSVKEYFSSKHDYQIRSLNGQPIYDVEKKEIPPTVAAILYNVNLGSIYNHLKKGKIPYKKNKSFYVLNENELDKIYSRR